MLKRTIITISLVIGLYKSSQIRERSACLQAEETPMATVSFDAAGEPLATPATGPSQPATPSSSFCPAVENCLFYQVNMNYTDYGCSVCQKDFIATAGRTGVGHCRQRNPIRFCRGAQQRPDVNDNEPFCFQCEKDYMLKVDSFNCSPIPSEKKIENCLDYYSNKTEIYCNVCESGFTLDETRKKCEEGCRISNCESCSIVYGRHYCFNCQPGFIGIYDNTTFIYKKCLSCDDYQYNLQILNSTYVPLI